MNETFAAPLARILLRYVAGVLVAKGLLLDPASLLSPDVEQGVTLALGAGLSTVAEGWWYIARKRDRKPNVDRDH